MNPQAVQVLEVSNVGPVKSLKIPLPAGGGVVVLRGPNGSGKSTVLEGARRVLGGESGPLTPTDGAKRGIVTLGDAKLSVTPKRTATSGELEVSSIEGRFDVSDLIDPGIKDPERADVARLKALVALSGVNADESPYIELVGAELWRDIRSIIDTTDDPIKLCASVKRAVELGARTWEEQAESKRIEMLAAEKQIDPTLPAAQEPEVFRVAIDAATDHLSALKAGQHAYSQALAASEAARQQLAEITAKQANQPTVEQLQELAQAKRLAAADAANRIDQLKKELSAVEIAWTEARAEARAAEQRIDVATRHQQSIEALQATYAKALPVCPSDHDVTEAEQAKTAALEAYTANERARDNANRLKLVTTLRESYKQRAMRAIELRDLAASVESVLAQLIDAGPIRIESGRLVVTSDRSASELYAELSHGERAKIAIDIAADHVPANGLVVIRQEVWESLQPANRLAVHQHAIARGVTVLTAAVDDGDGISIEQMGGER